MTAKIHRGACFCGAISITATGDPVAMGYCHCESCRQWSATPVTAYSLWRPESVKITAATAAAASQVLAGGVDMASPRARRRRREK